MEDTDKLRFDTVAPPLSELAQRGQAVATMQDNNKCMTALLAAARRLDAMDDIETSHLTVTPMGAKVVMFRTMPDGSLAHVEYLMAWDEIALTKFDLLDSLISDMHEKLMLAKYEEQSCISPR